MDASDAIQVLILIFLIACSAFFSSSETAMTTVSKIRVRNLAEGGDRRAILLSRLIEEPGKMLSAILIGNNIVNISASSLATILATKWLGSAGAGISTGALTLIILVFGEVTPKTCATIDPEKQSLRSAQIIYTWTQIATPLIFIVNHLTMGLMFLMRVDPRAKNDSYTEEDIRSIVDVSHEDGVIEQEEKELGKKSKLLNKMAQIDKKKYEKELVAQTDPVGKAKTGKYNAETEEIPITVKNIQYADKGIQSVMAAVWKYDDQSDLQWVPLAMFDGDVWKGDIDISAYEDPKGAYNIHVYLVDGKGDLYNIAQTAKKISK